MFVSNGMKRSAVLLAGLVLAAACGDGSATTTTAPPAVTTVAATTAPSTTTPSVPPSSTTAPTTTTTAPPPTTTTVAAPLAITAESIEIAAEDGRYTISADLPQLFGLDDRAVQDRVNRQIRDEVEATVEWYRASFEEAEIYEDVPASEMGLGFEATLLNARVLSLRFGEYWYYSGAAHPDDTIWTLLFNLDTGEEYTLPELLSSDAAPQALLELIERHLIDDVWDGDAEGLSAWVDIVDELYFGEWALTETSFDVSFGRYEIGPGVLGSVTVSIPYEELGVLVNPDGPIGDLVG